MDREIEVDGNRVYIDTGGDLVIEDIVAGGMFIIDKTQVSLLKNYLNENF